jgi:hypothetical protein
MADSNLFLLTKSNQKRMEKNSGQKIAEESDDEIAFSPLKANLNCDMAP